MNERYRSRRRRVYAVGQFDPAELGVYALFFAIFLVAAIGPSSLVFLSGEVRLLDLARDQRLDGFRLTLPAGLRVGGGGCSSTVDSIEVSEETDHERGHISRIGLSRERGLAGS